MKRGEVWTLRDDAYASKARPVVVVQGEDLNVFDSVVLCLLTSFDSRGIQTRVEVDPDDENGLSKKSFVMTDKIVTVRKDQLGRKIGRIDPLKMTEVDNALAKVLGLER